MPQVLQPALQKDSNISFCCICVLCFWNLGSWGEEQIGRPSLLQKCKWRNTCLCEWPHFLATSWTGAAGPCRTSSKQPEPSINTPAPCVQRYARRGDLSWAESNIRPPLLCIASLIPVPSSRKPRLPLFICTLITQSESPGLQFPLQRRCWLLCWRWSLIILVMSGWYVPPAGITAGGGCLAEWGHWHAVRAEGWKKGSLQCSALVVRPPLRDSVPVISGFLHRCSLKGCQLLPTVMVVFVLCLLLIEIGETCGIWFYKEGKEEMFVLYYATHHRKAHSLCMCFKRKRLAQSKWYMQPYF